MASFSRYQHIHQSAHRFSPSERGVMSSNKKSYLFPQEYRPAPQRPMPLLHPGWVYHAVPVWKFFYRLSSSPRDTFVDPPTITTSSYYQQWIIPASVSAFLQHWIVFATSGCISFSNFFVGWVLLPCHFPVKRFSSTQADLCFFCKATAVAAKWFYYFAIPHR